MNAAINQLVEVANKQTAIIEYNSVPVMTSDQLAGLYGTELIRIQQNHTRNKSKFTEGKHFYKVVGDELRQFKSSLTSSEIVSQNAKHLILWTERGAARHAKILDTEQAWEVFEQLEDCYFHHKDLTNNSHFNELMPTTYLEALKALVSSEEQKQLIAKERDHAIETKAHISDKKTATAMATASIKSKEAEKLKEQLGESKNYASVKAVESKVGGKYNWRELKKWCVANGKKIKDIADANYGTVKIYHKDAWNAVYGIKLTDLFGT